MHNPTQISPRSPGEAFKAKLPWFCLAAGGAAVWALSLGHQGLAEGAQLLASVTVAQDSDGDGLSDTMEYTFGTSPFICDSDGDGYEDGVELALMSSPVSTAWTPQGNSGLGVGMLAHGGEGRTTVQLLLFSQDGTLANKSFAMSMTTPTGIFTLDLNRLAGISSATDRVLGDGALLRVVNIPVSPLMIQIPGVVHLIGALGNPSTGTYSAAAVCRLEGIQATNEVFWTRQGHTLPPTSGAPPTPGSVINQPIAPFNGEFPPLGQPGEVCVQITQVVGSGAGSTIITEVISADCQPGWAAYCSVGACNASVGETRETINPRNLLGG